MMINAQLDKSKKLSLTNLYFNRFLAIRYSTAFLLFLNLYWAVFLLGSKSYTAILPITLFILGALTAFEQVKLYRNHDNFLPFAKLFFQMMLLMCGMLVITLYTSLFHLFFPFLKDSQPVLNTIMGLLIGSGVIAFLMLKRLAKIQRNEDKHFKRIQTYEEIIN